MAPKPGVPSSESPPSSPSVVTVGAVVGTVVGAVVGAVVAVGDVTVVTILTVGDVAVVTIFAVFTVFAVLTVGTIVDLLDDDTVSLGLVVGRGRGFTGSGR